MKTFLRENPTIAFGLGLPLLLVAPNAGRFIKHLPAHSSFGIFPTRKVDYPLVTYLLGKSSKPAKSPAGLDKIFIYHGIPQGEKGY